ncbi:primosomal replication protein PriC [Erwinia psidii]|uniref:Prephenate dehydrogenase n=1 Tax=Erwinia psidii TaxID=69224 RepID=A0A3N6S3F3_9GAMM|nr:primosomal replication protein [Erwinia psidii]MCX8958038.1 prephenate dehydrogenase [Erwinia psidii]MCX8962564.1 prephenate dehydrogenase [Erwinia psidii]MCX8963887.1 prephenate dehydrogenase [Erwinia psidii]RQM39387.1 prephenate dehydrogenase [Erwinia psidii]
MKRGRLLSQLEVKLQELALAVAPHVNERTASARFDGQLFHCNSTRLGDYLKEVHQSLDMLKQSINGHHNESVAWVAERMVLQIGALQREIATRTLRKAEIRSEPESDSLYEKLAKHQDYARRLRAMISDRESQLEQQDTLAQQQHLQREIAAQEGRLQRCLQALKRIERAIEKSEQ